jgi:hypothetical protein
VHSNDLHADLLALGPASDYSPFKPLVQPGPCPSHGSVDADVYSETGCVFVLDRA